MRINNRSIGQSVKKKNDNVNTRIADLLSEEFNGWGAAMTRPNSIWTLVLLCFSSWLNDAYATGDYERVKLLRAQATELAHFIQRTALHRKRKVGRVNDSLR